MIFNDKMVQSRRRNCFSALRDGSGNGLRVQKRHPCTRDSSRKGVRVQKTASLHPGQMYRVFYE